MLLFFFVFLIFGLKGFNVFHCSIEHISNGLLFGHLYQDFKNEQRSVIYSLVSNDSLINGFCNFGKIKLITNNVFVLRGIVSVKHEFQLSPSILIFGDNKFFVDSGTNFKFCKHYFNFGFLKSKVILESKYYFDCKKVLKSFSRRNFMRYFVIKFYLNRKVVKCYCFRRFITYWIFCNYYNHFRSKNADNGFLYENSIRRFEKIEKFGLKLFLIKIFFVDLVEFFDISRLIGSCSNYAGDGPKRIYDSFEIM